MTYSVIKKLELERALRLDAEYYQPENLLLIKRLRMIPTVALKELAYITDGEHGSPIFDKISGIRYFSAQHVRDCTIDPTSAKTISSIIDNRNQRSRLKRGDILLSTVGTIGFAGLVTEDLLPANIDRHVARINLSEQTLDPEFLVAFLNSKYGRLQTLREATGNVQLNLFIDKIKELRVPELNNPEVTKCVRISLEQAELSKNLYSNVEQLLLEELELNDYIEDSKLSWMVNSSDFESPKRLDAEYFQPKYKDLIAKLKIYNSKLFSEVINNVPAKFEPSREPNRIFNYVELSDIDSSVGVINGSSSLTGNEAPSRAKRVLKANDVIISSIEGSLEKVALVTNEQEGFLASTGFFQLRSGEILPEVLLVLSKSIVFRMQLQQRTAGTILSAVPKETLNDLLIPILPDNIQRKIADLVRQAHASRKKSKVLLEDAKWKIEEMIENNS